MIEFVKEMLVLLGMGLGTIAGLAILVVSIWALIDRIKERRR